MKKMLLVSVLMMAQNLFGSTTFILPTTIGGKIFNDVLVLDQDGPGELTGTLTVPGIFSEPLVKGKMYITWAGPVYTFTIVAHENGEATVINYEFGNLHIGPEGLHGKLTLEDGTVIGEIHNAYKKLSEK